MASQKENSMNQATIYNADCVAGMADKMGAESVDLTVTSPPFADLFMYSGKNEDMGNNGSGLDLEECAFGLHFRHFVAQLLRVHKPGTNACIHIQQLLAYKVQHGFMGRRDFRGAIVNMFVKGGFEWKGEWCIPKNPQLVAKRQNLHCLMFVTGRRDAAQLAACPNDYLMVFQKPGERAEPVHALYDKRDNPQGWVSTEEWIKWASGVWDDIRETDVLEGRHDAREENDEKHVCPLQLEVIRRCVRLYTNAGERVLDPFMGIGSTAYVALEQQRSALGFELKESYHAKALRNVARIQNASEREAPLFSIAEACEGTPQPTDHNG
jgi:DNA modification methylase